MSRLLKFIFWGGMLAATSGLLVGWGGYLHYSRDLPTLNGLADYTPSLVTRVYARDYQLLGEFFVERRKFIPRAEVPQMLVNAFLAIEDSNFYQHHGIDPQGILRATVANLKAMRPVQGASTITQQVAKTFLLSPERTFGRKFREVILSLRIEKRFSKDEILELYLNQIYLGAGAYGVAAASRIYFDRDVSELTLGQMAMLAALPKAPSNYDPWQHPEAARQRQLLVLQRMAEVNHVTQEEADKAAASDLELARPQVPLEKVSPHYLEHVRRTIHADWGYRYLYHGGLDVYTALEPRLQKAAKEAVQAGLVELDRRHGYRGPVERLEKTDPASVEAWLDKGRKTPRSIAGYVRALVVEPPSDRQARLLTLDGRAVELPFEGLEWARPVKPKGPMGPVPRSLREVLKAGDVVLLELPPEEKQNGTLALAGKERPRLASGSKLAQEPVVEAALVAIDPHTGHIVAMVGGYDYEKSEYNRATQARRQPGSSFKPFIYAAALDKEFSPVTLIDDSPMPMVYRDPVTGARKVWQPENYEGKFFGPTTLRVGLEHSRNLVTIRLLKTIGVSYAVPYIERFGLSVPEGRRDLSIALGTLDFTPLEMASAYAVFANGGKLVRPAYITRIQDRFGRTVGRHPGGDCLLCHADPVAEERAFVIPTAPPGGEVVSAVSPPTGVAAVDEDEPPVEQTDKPAQVFGNRVISEVTAYQLTALLKGVIARGTARKALELNRPLAGKTGTTNDLKDAWFIGYSPSLVVAVWVGKDDATSLGGRETGGKAALPIWMRFMSEALRDQPSTDFSVPPGIRLELIDAENGNPVSGETRLTVMEAFREGQGPGGRRSGSSGEIREEEQMLGIDGVY